MKLTFNTNKNFVDYRGKVHKDVYICECKFSEKDKVKQCGFWWNPANKVWYTPYRDNAVRLAEFSEGDLKNELMSELQAKESSLEASRATDNTEIDIPVPDGLSYLPFQRAGIAFGRERTAVLIGDEMGLGKTIQAIGIINIDPTIKKVLVICPATPKINWKKEMTKWLVRDFDISVQNSTDTWDYLADINIVNYDILKKFHDQIHSTEWDLVIVDECHYLKNPDAQRTQEVVGKYYKWRNKSDREVRDILAEYRAEKLNKWGQQLGMLKARKRIMLTGTPIPNKPIEIWPIVHYLDPDTFSNFMWFAKRYCSAGHNGYGYDFSGGRNLEELQEKLRTSIMIRRLKKEVLKELPPKYRQVIEIPPNGNSAIVARERARMAEIEARLEDLKVAVELAKISDDPKDYINAVKNLRSAVMVSFEEMSRVRHETALAKVPDIVTFLKDAISNHKVVVFAHHRDVIEQIEAAFGDVAVKLYGGMKDDAKNAAIEKFQTDDNVKLFIGSIGAAGVAITLTAASHVVFAELDWVPGNMTQAEDRCHRIGQTDNVLVQHLVLEGSLDAHMAYKLVEKQEMIDKALDEDIEIIKVKYFVTPGDDAATKNTPKSKIEKIAEKMTAEQRAAAHMGLKMLAGMCDGARELDGVGFNKIDTKIGKSLAASNTLTPKQAAFAKILVTKYRGQLPENLIEAVKGE